MPKDNTPVARLKIQLDVFTGRSITEGYTLETGKELPEDFVDELVQLIEKHGGTVSGTKWTKEMMDFVPFEKSAG